MFVVRPDAVASDDDQWRSQVHRLEAAVTRGTGNDARVLEFSAGEVASGLDAGERILRDVWEDGVPLAGDALYLETAAEIGP